MAICKFMKVATAVLATAALTGDVSGQNLEPGMRVRLYPVSTSADQPYVGTIDAIDSTRVVLIRSSPNDRVEVPIDVITKYEVSLGRMSGNRAAMQGMKNGALIGATIGVTFGIFYAHHILDASFSGDGGARPSPEYLKYASRGLLGIGAGGAVIGGVIGRNVTEKWSPVIKLH